MDVGVVKPLRLDGRITAVVGSPSRSMADSTIGVAPAAMGVWPSSACEKNLDLPAWPSNVVMSFRAEFLPTWRCGPRFSDGGDSGGLRISPILGPEFWKVSCAAEGEAQGSVDSWPEQAKLQTRLAKARDHVTKPVWRNLTIELPGPVARVGLPIHPIA